MEQQSKLPICLYVLMIILHKNIHNSIKQIYVKSHPLILNMVKITEVIIINISR